MDLLVMLAFVFLPPAIAFYAGHILDDKVWKANLPFDRAKRLAGWSWILISLIPFTTGTVILVFVWLPLLRQIDFITKMVPFMFGAMHLLLGIVFVIAGVHYFFKRL